MKLKPLGKNILIELLVPEERTASGIILPDASRKHEEIGKVISVGNGVVDIQEGQTVMYRKWAGNETKEKTILVPEEDVLAIVE